MNAGRDTTSSAPWKSASPSFDIGSATLGAGLRRLRDAVDAAPAVSGAEPERPPSSWIGIGVAGVVCVAVFVVPVGSAPRWATNGIVMLAQRHAVPSAWARLRRERRKNVRS